MPAIIAFSRDMLATEVLLGGQDVVRRAAKGKVFEVVPSALRKWLQVMNLEAVRLSTALTALVDVGASAAVTLEDCPSFGCGDVSAALALVLAPW